MVNSIEVIPYRTGVLPVVRLANLFKLTSPPMPKSYLLVIESDREHRLHFREGGRQLREGSARRGPRTETLLVREGKGYGTFGALSGPNR